MAHEPRTLANQIVEHLGKRFLIEQQTLPDSTTAIVRAALTLRRKEYDVVHLFGSRLLRIASTIARSRVLFSPDGFLSRRDRNWLRAIVRYRDVTTICPTDTQRRSLVESGVPIEKTVLIRPGVDFGSVGRRDRALRESLGFTDDDYVILAAGESSIASNHRLTCWAASVLNVLDGRYKMLAWASGPQSDIIRTFASRSLMPFATFAGGGGGRKSDSAVLHSSAKIPGSTYEQLLAVADVVLATATDPAPTLPLQLAMAAGVPIVSTAGQTTAEIVQDRSTALLVPKPHPRLLARRILDLREDETLKRTIVDRARAEAYEYFVVSKTMEAVWHVYEGTPVSANS